MRILGLIIALSFVGSASAQPLLVRLAEQRIERYDERVNRWCQKHNAGGGCQGQMGGGNSCRGRSGGGCHGGCQGRSGGGCQGLSGCQGHVASSCQGSVASANINVTTIPSPMPKQIYNVNNQKEWPQDRAVVNGEGNVIAFYGNESPNVIPNGHRLVDRNKVSLINQ